MPSSRAGTNRQRIGSTFIPLFFVSPSPSANSAGKIFCSARWRIQGDINKHAGTRMYRREGALSLSRCWTTITPGTAGLHAARCSPRRRRPGTSGCRGGGGCANQEGYDVPPQRGRQPQGPRTTSRPQKCDCTHHQPGLVIGPWTGPTRWQDGSGDRHWGDEIVYSLVASRAGQPATRSGRRDGGKEAKDPA